MSVHELLALFRLGLNPLELLVRGTAVYWFLFLLFRFVLRRDTGSLGIADILLLVLIADASQNAMAGGYETVADGLVLVATIMGWNWLMDWASFHSRAVRRFATPPPLVLVRQGKLLREQGIDKLADVKIARMEADGGISVIRTQPEGDEPGGRGRRPGVSVG
jgi:uncharacterized membrane protein YcaP (DUF421 family)